MLVLMNIRYMRLSIKRNASFKPNYSYLPNNIRPVRSRFRKDSKLDPQTAPKILIKTMYTLLRLLSVLLRWFHKIKFAHKARACTGF